VNRTKWLKEKRTKEEQEKVVLAKMIVHNRGNEEKGNGKK
jgi:hypothetical protein